MINAMTSVLGRLKATISSTLLDLAFKPDKYGVSLDQRIIDAVITPRVLVDCNTNGGKKANIPILLHYEQRTEDPPVMFSGYSRMSAIYSIPDSAREGMNIGSIINTSYFGDYSAMYPNASAGFFNRGNNLANVASYSLNSRTLGDANISPRAILLNGNMIRCTPPIYTDGTVLNCWLEYDSEFTNLAGASILPLQRLVTCAVKSWIYKELIIAIDMQLLSGGQPVGVIKQLVEDFKDEESKYDELLNNFRGSIMYDPDMAAYFISNAIPT
jgi:hypothetical protein